MENKIKNIIKELKEGNPYTNDWIIEELEEILELIKQKKQ
jgi:hypothetical protein